MTFTYDYTKTMMMKLLMAVPDRKGGSKIIANAEKALDTIRQIDNLTLGIPKIIYLVGWQYLGHDDKYPAFFEINEGIKGQGMSAKQSLLRLIEEAKKYNTVVSLHINFTDAYEDSPIFEEYVKANALIRTSSGKPAKIEKYNGKPCYKISYKEEWESGLFKERVDRLLALLPIEEAGTVHVDNFQCYVNRFPYISAQEMKLYRRKMINYLREKGIDITTEFTYREGRGTRLLYGKITRDFTPRRYPIACLNEIPAVWWTDKMSLEEYFTYYPHIHGGGIPKDNRALNLFYGNIHAEELIKEEDWHRDFIRHFMAINVPFFYLNNKNRLGFDKSGHKVIYDDGTVSSDNGTILSKDGDEERHGRLKITNMGKLKITDCSVFMPYRDGFAVYSDKSQALSRNIANGKYSVYEITADGLHYIGEYAVTDGRISIDAYAGKAYFIKKA